MYPDDGTLAPLAGGVDAGLTSAVIEVTLVGKPDKNKILTSITWRPSLYGNIVNTRTNNVT